MTYSLVISQFWLGCPYDNSNYHTQCSIIVGHSTALREHTLCFPLSNLQVQSPGLKMGLSTASTLFMLTLVMGLVRDDGIGMADGLAGKGSPDFPGYEEYLRNISGSRMPGENLNKHCESVSLSASQSPMQQKHAIFTQNIHPVSYTMDTITAIYGLFKGKFKT